MKGTFKADTSMSPGNWRTWDVGDNIWYFASDADDHNQYAGQIIEKHEDHLIARAAGRKLWINDATRSMFERRKQK